MTAGKIVLYPLQSEKSIRLMESQNVLMFAVEKTSSKNNIKKEIEKIFKVKVVKVNTFVNPKGEKRAYVKLSPENQAIDIATQLGMM